MKIYLFLLLSISSFRNQKVSGNDVLDFADSYHDLEHFYEHQKPTWDRLRMAYTTYTLNRAQLEQDATAAAALRRMQDILTATSPYSLIQEATSLITTVEGVNATLLAQHRAATCQKIEEVMAALTKDIALVHGDEALTSICLGPLAKLRVQVEGEASIAHIVQAEQQALTFLDTAQGHIQEFVRKVPEKLLVKKVHPIKPAALVKATYLETLDDVHGFLDQLRTEMEDAIHKGERIQIR